jgi:hypothetical protein
MAYPEYNLLSCDVCSRAKLHRRFGTEYLHLQSKKVNKANNHKRANRKHQDLRLVLDVCGLLVYSSALKMEVLCSSETSMDFSRSIWRHIPEDRTLHNHSCEKLKRNKGYQMNFPFTTVFAETFILTNSLECNLSRETNIQTGG